jgi:hypothetical protein
MILDVDVSLLDGWLPWTLRVLTLALVVVTIGRRRLRNREFLLKRLPIVLGGSVLFGALCEVLVRTAFGISDPLPFGLWFWLAVFALALGLAIVCWRGSRWWQRTAAPLAMLLALLTAADALDISLGYYPTLADMYGELTNQALPQQISLSQLGRPRPAASSSWTSRPPPAASSTAANTSTSRRPGSAPHTAPSSRSWR